MSACADEEMASADDSLRDRADLERALREKTGGPRTRGKFFTPPKKKTPLVAG